MRKKSIIMLGLAGRGLIERLTMEGGKMEKRTKNSKLKFTHGANPGQIISLTHVENHVFKDLINGTEGYRKHMQLSPCLSVNIKI